jgi:4-hydroxy-tetrahydrodipicolinate reductase
MKIILIGYGKMGKLLEIKAKERKHIILKVLNNPKWSKEDLVGCDVAIDFSNPSSALENIHKSFQIGVPIVVGTTGWYDQIEKVKFWCNKYDGSILPATNFSLGVNIFFEINKHLSKLMNNHKSYTSRIEETHHKEKIDSPSGTAITTAEIILSELDKYTQWSNSYSNVKDNLNIVSKRENQVPGIHEVFYENNIDEITVSHRAKNREGFAIGAIVAAEFILGKKGFYSIKDILKF